MELVFKVFQILDYIWTTQRVPNVSEPIRKFLSKSIYEGSTDQVIGPVIDSQATVFLFRQHYRRIF